MKNKYKSNLIKDLKSRLDPKSKNRTRDRMLVSAWIDDRIKEKGWTKKEFADRMGKKPSVVTRWLSGDHNFTFETLSDIQFVLGKSFYNFKQERKTQVKAIIVMKESVDVPVKPVNQYYPRESMLSKVSEPIFRYKTRASQPVEEC